MPPINQFRIRDKLSNVLKAAGATETVFSPKQILSYLGKYIEQKKLHDKTNMRIVRCEGDALEELFGVQEFVISSCKEIWNFVLPHIIPAASKESSNEENHPVTSDNDDNIVTRLEHSWMTQLPWWYFVQKPEKAQTATGSIMDNSTAFVKDTEYSTDVSDSIQVLSYGERFSEEFEPDSGSSSGSLTDSDDTEPVDSEEEMTYSTPSIPLMDSCDSTMTDDYWECSVCPNMNPPIVGYCQRCWKFRENWWKSSVNDITPLKSISLTQISELDDVPLLPRWSSDPQGVDVTDGKSLKRTRSQSEEVEHSKKPALEREQTLTVTSQCENIPSSSTQPDDVKSSFPNSRPSTIILPSLPSSCLNPSSSESKSYQSELRDNNSPLSSDSRIKITPSNCVISKQQSTNSAAQMSEPSIKNNFTTLPFNNKPKLPDLPGICNICRSHPNNASFVHGQTGHQYCCHKCAIKVMKRDGRCPVCRKPIEIVIKNYIYQM